MLMVAYLLDPWLNRDIVENIGYNSAERLPSGTLIEYPEVSYERELLGTPVSFANRIEFLSDIEMLSAKKMTAQDIARQLGVTTTRVNIMARKFGVTSTVDKVAITEYEIFTFEVITHELEWQQTFEQLDEYVSLSTVADLIGKTKEWVLTNAAGLDFYPEDRPLNTARLVRSYPKEVVDMLRTISLHFPPANNLYNMTEVEAKLGKSNIWINKMVELHGLPASMRTATVTKRVGVHFYEETVQELKKLVDALPEPAGDRFTVSRMATLLNKSSRWVNKRLIPYEAEGNDFLDDFSRPSTHYPKEVFEALKELASEIPSADGWFTNNNIRQILGVKIDWLDNRLKDYWDVAEMRISIAGKAALHYSPEVAEEIEELAHQHYGTY